jgi:hypothetical protein
MVEMAVSTFFGRISSFFSDLWIENLLFGCGGRATVFGSIFPSNHVAEYKSRLDNQMMAILQRMRPRNTSSQGFVAKLPFDPTGKKAGFPGEIP